VDHYFIFVFWLYTKQLLRFVPKGVSERKIANPAGIFYLEETMDKEQERLPVTADQVARKRLFDYLSEKLEGEFSETQWEFYTWLLEKAEWRSIDRSGYLSPAYQKDKDEALKNLNKIRMGLKEELALEEAKS
jgi:hypothetical protein